MKKIKLFVGEGILSLQNQIDNWIEENHFRKITAENAKSRVFDIFDTYKKAHGMPSYT